MTINRVFVAGATGGVGRRVVALLLEQHYQVTALSRDADKAKALFGDQVKVVSANALEQSQVADGMRDCDAAICCIGAPVTKGPWVMYRDDFKATRSVIDAAKQASVERFICISTLGAGKPFHLVNFFWLSGTYKAKNEDYLRQSGLQYSIVRPGGLRDDDLDRPPQLGDQGDFNLGMVNRQNVAELLVACLQEPTTIGQTIEIMGSREQQTQPTLPEQLHQLYGATSPEKKARPQKQAS